MTIGTNRFDQRPAVRIVAADMGVEVHGVLWLLDLLHAAGNSLPGLLVTALETWRDDPAIFLPTEEVETRRAYCAGE